MTPLLSDWSKRIAVGPGRDQLQFFSNWTSGDEVRKQFGRIAKTVGVLLVPTGVAFLTGGFQSVSLWLIEN